MKETILIVDDTPTNLQLLVRLLSDRGYRARVAQDGLSAMQQAVQEPPDLILLDVMMPQQDGYETCRQLKANPDTSEIPVIFMTARSEIADKLRGFELGAVDYIIKPFQKEEVIARVNTHLTLRRQQRELKALLEQRSRFMRIAAHDLRNPLTAIHASADLGLLTDEVEASRRFFERILKASAQMKALIDDFLSVNVLMKRGGHAPGVIDLEKVIDNLFEQVGPLAGAKGSELIRDTPPGPLLARGNADHTHQILTNYLSNGLKYSPAHSTIQLSVRLAEAYWRIEVADQGPGILPKEREGLFVEFARTSNKPTGGEISTGLGLFIVKTLAEAQGGRVGACFPDTGGSVFWVEIPVSEPSAG